MAMGTGTWTPQDVARCPGTCTAAKRGQEDVTTVQFCAVSLSECGALRPTTSQDWSSAAFPTLGKILGTAGVGGSSVYVLLSLVNKETALAF